MLLSLYRVVTLRFSCILVIDLLTLFIYRRFLLLLLCNFFTTAMIFNVVIIVW